MYLQRDQVFDVIKDIPPLKRGQKVRFIRDLLAGERNATDYEFHSPQVLGYIYVRIPYSARSFSWSPYLKLSNDQLMVPNFDDLKALGTHLLTHYIKKNAFSLAEAFESVLRNCGNLPGREGMRQLKEALLKAVRENKDLFEQNEIDSVEVTIKRCPALQLVSS